VPTQAWSSTVYRAQWNEAEVDARITEVIELFRSHHHAFVWLVTPFSAPASLGQRLLARGFIRELEGRMLIAELPLAGLRVNPQVRVALVVDRAGVRDSLRVDHPTWDDARVAPELEDRWLRLGKDYWVAVAYLGDQPVGSARWSLNRQLGVVEFSGAETLPAYRNRGVYSTLVAFRTEHAAREGASRAGIIADVDTSAPILLKRGFADLGGATFYLWRWDRFDE
jgi:GNAT superfamily N-acetyltransferase